jgi:hypothetical protein
MVNATATSIAGKVNLRPKRVVDCGSGWQAGKDFGGESDKKRFKKLIFPTSRIVFRVRKARTVTRDGVSMDLLGRFPILKSQSVVGEWLRSNKALGLIGTRSVRAFVAGWFLATLESI